MLPPVIVELRAVAGGAVTEINKFKASIDDAAGKGKTALAGLQRIGKAAMIGTAVAAVALGYEALKIGRNFQQAMTLLQTGAGSPPATSGWSAPASCTWPGRSAPPRRNSLTRCT